MTEIYLVRHGQASFGQKNYDVLSELGRQQALWLGEWLAQSQLQFDSFYSGTLMRQQHTLHAITDALKQPVTESLPHFNEFDFVQIVNAFLKQNPEQNNPEPDRRVWFKTLRKSMHAWSSGQLDVNEHAETWTDFLGRVREGLNYIMSHQHERVVIATSGGVIASAVGLTLGLCAQDIIKLNLQVQNTSITRLIVKPQSWALHSFNTVPHLSSQERAQHITYA
ncbi:histidine phosphatase family protein [Alteromonas lipotrueiana]|uniref:histidine phosphatase family protein n=1 Tax=Alteromonas lipotrueiana TaxID=2803815 RepID=UPI001C470258|nr:histidine phosphatase family protein [Alteromonas lipotrueiana]